MRTWIALLEYERPLYPEVGYDYCTCFQRLELAWMGVCVDVSEQKYNEQPGSPPIVPADLPTIFLGVFDPNRLKIVKDQTLRALALLNRPHQTPFKILFAQTS